jgi:hypothetical protein
MTTVNAQLMNAAKIVALALCGAALTGCAKHSKPASASTMEPEPTPLVIDEATQMRDWDRSTAYYANGDVPSPPVREKFGEPNTGNEFYDAVLDPFYFAGNTLYLPISLFEQPPGTEVYSTGVQVEPTYTAAPVLPPFPPETTKPATLPGTAPSIENLYPPTDVGPEGGAADPRSGPPRDRPVTAPDPGAQPPAPAPGNDATPPTPAPDATPAPAPAPAPAPGANPAPAPDAAPAPAPAPDATPAPAPAPAADQGAAPALPGEAPAPAPAPDANK